MDRQMLQADSTIEHKNIQHSLTPESMLQALQDVFQPIHLMHQHPVCILMGMLFGTCLNLLPFIALVFSVLHEFITA